MVFCRAPPPARPPAPKASESGGIELYGDILLRPCVVHCAARLHSSTYHPLSFRPLSSFPSPLSSLFSPLSFLLSPFSFLLSPFPFLLSPFSFPLSPFSFLLSPSSFLLSSRSSLLSPADRELDAHERGGCGSHRQLHRRLREGEGQGAPCKVMCVCVVNSRLREGEKQGAPRNVLCVCVVNSRQCY